MLALGMVATTASCLAAGQGVERNRQKEAAEEQRAELQQKLTALKRLIDATETTKNQAADALAQSETAISEANRSLADLLVEQKATQQRLARLSLQLEALKATLASRQRQLSVLFREQYVAGNEDRIKLLLSGDDPTRINRSQRYMGYVSRAQAQLIENLRVNLKAIQDNQAEAQEASNDLNDIAAESRLQNERLEQQKKQRARLLAQIGAKLAQQRTEAGMLERDDNRLGKVVDQLSKLIAQQRAAEAAARARRQVQQEAAAKLRRDREKAALAAATARSSVAPPSRESIDSEEAPKSATPAPSLSRDSDNSSEITARKLPSDDGGSTTGSTPSAVSGATSGLPLFSGLKGRLKLPIRGELSARFGARREDGPTSKGVFIRAAEGTQVHAIAAGQVVFAEWLRGFGNLIIVDHGTQYLSIYGNNQAVLKHAGDRVEPGEVIATAGNTGGNEQSGLYFEMRYQGRAFDPLVWVTTR